MKFLWMFLSEVRDILNATIERIMRYFLCSDAHYFAET